MIILGLRYSPKAINWAVSKQDKGNSHLELIDSGSWAFPKSAILESEILYEIYAELSRLISTYSPSRIYLKPTEASSLSNINRLRVGRESICELLAGQHRLQFESINFATSSKILKTNTRASHCIKVAQQLTSTAQSFSKELADAIIVSACAFGFEYE